MWIVKDASEAERDARRYSHMLTEPVPHERLLPYGCTCTKCEDWRGIRIIPGTLVTGIEIDPNDGTGFGCPSWSPSEEFNWGTVIREISLVIADVPEHYSGGHLQAVMLLVPKLGLRVTSRKWLRTISGGRVSV